MDRKKYCIFACGGHGTRMGESLPKQFLRIGDRTILQISMEKVLQAVPDADFIVVLPSEYMQYWKDECSARNLVFHQHLVEGGITRFHSVRNALEKICGDDALVAVHDAVRPLCSAQMIARLFAEAEVEDAVVPVIPMVDTVKVLRACGDGSYSAVENESADRSVLFGAQTPQVFRAQTLKAAYRLPYNVSFTDDASVVEATGRKVKYVPGERYNIKITTPEDLLFARRLLL